MGTAATNTLKAIKWNSSMSVSDLAALNAIILQQGSRSSVTIFPIPSVNQGGLFIPTRGNLKLYEGDYLAVDPVTGEVYVINSVSAAGASWVHVP